MVTGIVVELVNYVTPRVAFYITIAMEFIGNVVSKHVNVSILPGIVDIVTDFIGFTLVILH